MRPEEPKGQTDAEQPVTYRQEVIRLPEGEVPHFFMEPAGYVEGVVADPTQQRLHRNDKGEVTQGTWMGFRKVEGRSEVVDMDIFAPGFIERAVARAKRRQPRYKLKVRYWS